MHSTSQKSLEQGEHQIQSLKREVKKKRAAAITDTEFEDNNDSKDSPNRISRDILRGLEKYEKRHQRQRQPHLPGENDLPGIRAPKLPPGHSHLLQLLP